MTNIDRYDVVIWGVLALTVALSLYGIYIGVVGA